MTARYIVGGWAACWGIVFSYWMLAALRAKRNAQPHRDWARLGVRVAALVVALAVLRFGGPRPDAAAPAWLPAGPAAGALGAGFTALGLAFAAWARVHLGRNWGMPMAVKQNPELVGSGPYAYVRHPIYTGLLVALLASTLVIGYWFLGLALISGIYMVFSARREERTLLGQFPEPYAAYMQRTKMLVPFVF